MDDYYKFIMTSFHHLAAPSPNRREESNKHCICLSICHVHSK